MTNTKAIDDLLASYTTGPTPKLPGVALIAIRTSGAIIYSSSSGPIAINSSKSFTTKTPCFVASMGKLPTVIAVLQCVERGQIKLDDEVESILPEVKEMDVFEGFDEDGKPKLRKAKGKITLRMLLNHSSGMTYVRTDPALQKLDKYNGYDRSKDVGSLKDFTAPLIFDPGEGWVYSVGVDWAGELVARLNKTTLQAYMAANIFKLPLAMYYTTFKPEAHPDPTYSKTVRSSMHYRNKKTGELTLGPSIMPIPAANDLGGSGLYSNADDFARLLLAVLQSLSNPTLPESLGISKGLLEEIFKNQLKPESGAEKGWEKILPIFRPYAMGNLPASVGVAPGLGCIVTTEDTEGMRKKGSVQWAGIPNLAYWIDPMDGVAGVMFTQLVPSNDKFAVELFASFEKEVYKIVRGEKGTNL